MTRKLESSSLPPAIVMRIGFIAIAILVSWKLALIGYIAAGIYLHRQKGMQEI